jgi:hypothetical protein
LFLCEEEHPVASSFVKKMSLAVVDSL